MITDVNVMTVPSIVEIYDKAPTCALQMAVLLSVLPRHILRSPVCVSHRLPSSCGLLTAVWKLCCDECWDAVNVTGIH